MAAVLFVSGPQLPTVVRDHVCAQPSGRASLAAWHSRQRVPAPHLLQTSGHRHPCAFQAASRPCARHIGRARRRALQLLRAQAQGVEEEEELISDYGELSQKVQDLAADVKERLEGTSLYLVGMMGSGKSTVGRLVARALAYPFLDCDSLIETLAGASVAQIFAEEGEDSFRDLETQVLQELMPFKAVVVSTGGGAVVRRQNWGLMQHGVVVWLSGAPELLARRALRDGTASRPLLPKAGGGGAAAAPGAAEGDEYARTVAKLRDILEARRAAYAAADLHIPLEAAPAAPGDCGAAAAVVAYRLLNALAERLKHDAEERAASQQFEIHDTGELPPSMRVRPLKKDAEA